MRYFLVPLVFLQVPSSSKTLDPEFLVVVLVVFCCGGAGLTAVFRVVVVVVVLLQGTPGNFLSSVPS